MKRAKNYQDIWLSLNDENKVTLNYTLNEGDRKKVHTSDITEMAFEVVRDCMIRQIKEGERTTAVQWTNPEKNYVVKMALGIYKLNEEKTEEEEVTEDAGNVSDT